MYIYNTFIFNNHYISHDTYLYTYAYHYYIICIIVVLYLLSVNSSNELMFTIICIRRKIRLIVLYCIVLYCNAGDPLETSGGLYRGPPSMLIYVNTIKRCACETLNQVQCSITMNVKLLQ